MYPMVTTTAMMPPAKIQSNHQGLSSLDVKKVPSVWMLSLPTTE